MSEIMKIIDERETQKRKTKTEKKKGDNSYSERVRPKWFCCEFKLRFLHLICKASLIFKSNLELALSIILKERELYKSKHVTVECRYFRICSKIKEDLHINWRKPNLNAQQNHLAFALSL